MPKKFLKKWMPDHDKVRKHPHLNKIFGTLLHDPTLIRDHFKNSIDVVIEGGPVPGRPSSVVSLIDDTPEVIREGLGDVSVFT